MTEIMITRPLLLILDHQSVRFMFASCRIATGAIATVARPGTGHLDTNVGQNGSGHARRIGN